MTTCNCTYCAAPAAPLDHAGVIHLAHEALERAKEQIRRPNPLTAEEVIRGCQQAQAALRAEG